MKGVVQYIVDDFGGCAALSCDGPHDHWLIAEFDALHRGLERHLRLRAEFERYLAEKGDVE